MIATGVKVRCTQQGRRRPYEVEGFVVHVFKAHWTPRPDLVRAYYGSGAPSSAYVAQKYDRIAVEKASGHNVIVPDNPSAFRIEIL